MPNAFGIHGTVDDDAIRVAQRQEITVAKAQALAAALNSALVIPAANSSGVTVVIRSGATTTGAITVEALINDADALTWHAIPFVSSVNGAAPVAQTTGILALATSGGVYRLEIPCLGATQVRIRVSTALGAVPADVSYVTHPNPLSQLVQLLGGTVAVSGTVTVTGTTVNPTDPSAHNLEGAATTNATSVKATAGNVLAVNVYNASAATVYLKYYNKASAPTVGTDVPVLTIPIAAGAVGPALNFGPRGHRFTTGIALAITANAANADATAVGAGVKVLTTYV